MTSLPRFAVAIALTPLACQPAAAKDPADVSTAATELTDAAAASSVPAAQPAAPPPRTIPVVRHQSPPPGYTEITTPHWTNVALGVAFFTLAYAPPALASTAMGGNAWTMQVPFVGPLMQMGATVDHYSAQGGISDPGTFIGVTLYFVLLETLSLVQMGGVVLTTVGLFQKQPHWVRTEVALVRTPQLGMKLRFTGSALQLSGQF